MTLYVIDDHPLMREAVVMLLRRMRPGANVVELDRAASGATAVLGVPVDEIAARGSTMMSDDDLADHTALAHWIGEPVELDVTVLDPPGTNQGVARFGKSDF